MTVKEFLRGIAGTQKRIDALMERRQHYYDIALQGTSVASATRQGGTNCASKVESAVCKLVDLEKDLDAEIDELVDNTRIAERLIKSLDDRRYKDVLRFRYLNNWSWDRIAQEMKYDRRWVLRLHGFALIEAEKLWEKGG